MRWSWGHWDGFGVVLGPLGWLWGGFGAIGMVMRWSWAHRDGFGVVMGPSDPSTCAVSSAFRPFQPLFPLFPPRFVVFSPFPPRFPQSCSNRGYPPEGSDEVRRFLPPPDAERFHFTALGAFKVSFSRNSAIYP